MSFRERLAQELSWLVTGIVNLPPLLLLALSCLSLLLAASIAFGVHP